MDYDLQQELDDRLAWVYPIPDDPVHQQQVVVGRYPGKSGCVRQQEEVGWNDDLVPGGFGSVREC
jgi:hypothetical protein